MWGQICLAPISIIMIWRWWVTSGSTIGTIPAAWQVAAYLMKKVFYVTLFKVRVKRGLPTFGNNMKGITAVEVICMLTIYVSANNDKIDKPCKHIGILCNCQWTRRVLSDPATIQCNLMAMICICNNVLLTLRLSSLNTKINTYLRTHLHLAKSQPSALYCLHLTSRSSRPCKKLFPKYPNKFWSMNQAFYLCGAFTLRPKQVLHTLVNLRSNT